jgi:hypothetical protein
MGAITVCHAAYLLADAIYPFTYLLKKFTQGFVFLVGFCA